MQIKTTVRDHLTLVNTASIKKRRDDKYLWECGEKETLVHCWWECKLVQPLWRTVLRFLKKLKIELPYDPAIPLLSIYPKEIKSVPWQGICIPMFTAALFTVAKTWKQPKCQWMNKETVVYIYTVEYYSALSMKEILGRYYSKWNKSDTKRQTLHDITYTWNLKKSNSETDSRMVVARGWKVGKMQRCWQRVQTFSHKMHKLREIEYTAWLITFANNVQYTWNLVRK